MQTGVLLSGEHPDLPLAELRAVAAVEDAGPVEAVDDRFAVVEGEIGCDRPAMTQRLFNIEHRGALEDIDLRVREDSYGVRCHWAEGMDPAAVEERVGAAIAGEDAVVDLDSPDRWYDCVLVDGELYLGERRCSVDRGGFEQRRSHLRPFSSPVSLHPRLARTMVNLARCGDGQRVADPFCGTGGILTEAGLVGLDVVGSDLSGEMVEGCRENLDASGIDAELFEAPVSEAADLVGAVDAVVTDMPYGRSSHASDSPGELLDDLLEFHAATCDGRLVLMTDMEEVRGREPDHELYVHRSLTRRLYVLEPGDVERMI